MITLVTGGIRSGKSKFAENKLKTDDVCYIATAKVEDEEMKKRVEHHRDSRNKNWRTYEGYRNLKAALGKEKNYILECAGNLVSNILFDMTAHLKDISSQDALKVENEIKKELQELLVAAKENDKNIIVVTNEVGLSLVPMEKLSRIYVDILGRTNQFIGELADEVYLVICSKGLKLK